MHRMGGSRGYMIYRPRGLIVGCVCVCVMHCMCIVGVAYISAFNLVKSVNVAFPRSTHRIGQRPPFYF